MSIFPSRMWGYPRAEALFLFILPTPSTRFILVKIQIIIIIIQGSHFACITTCLWRTSHRKGSLIEALQVKVKLPRMTNAHLNQYFVFELWILTFSPGNCPMFISGFRSNCTKAQLLKVPLPWDKYPVIFKLCLKIWMEKDADYRLKNT